MRPPVLVLHLAFQIMVGCGVLLLALSFLYLLARLRGWRVEDSPWLQRAVLLAGPLGFVALQAGWVVTEVGRQPFIIYNVMRTREAVTPSGHVLSSLVLFSLLYLALGVTLVFMLLWLAREPEGGAGHAP